MPADVRNLMPRYQTRRRRRPPEKHQQLLKLFPLSRPLVFHALDTLRPLMRTKLENQFIVVVTDRLSQLTRAISVAKITTRNVATEMIEHWALPYGALDIIPTDNCKQFTSKFFAVLCASLETKLVTTSEYHSQPNGQVEHYNQTLDARLRLQIEEH